MSETTSEGTGVQVMERLSGNGQGGGLQPPQLGVSASGGSPFQVPFLGWNALADLIEEENPGIAHLMYGSALLVQRAIERGASELLEASLVWLQNSGAPEQVRSDLERVLFTSPLPFTEEDVAFEIASAYEELSDGERPFFSNDSETPLEDAAIASFLEVTSDSTLRAQYEETAALVSNSSVGHRRWWTTCSLELPEVLGPAQSSIVCSVPRHKRDRVKVFERTYLGSLEKSLDQIEIQRGPIVDGYRPTIGDPRVKNFWDHVGFTNAHGYGIRMGVGWRSQVGNRFAKRMEENKEVLDIAIQGVLSGARVAALGALSAVTGPLALVVDPALRIASSLVTTLLEKLQHVVLRALTDAELTSWLIVHTVIIDQAGVPMSVFILDRPDDHSSPLNQFSTFEDGSVSISDDYGIEPGFHQHARYMIGQSSPPEDVFKDALWEETAQRSIPISWTDPAVDRGGFRVLVPHTSTDNRARYVSAIRAEIRFETTRISGARKYKLQ